MKKPVIVPAPQNTHKVVKAAYFVAHVIVDHINCASTLEVPGLIGLVLEDKFLSMTCMSGTVLIPLQNIRNMVV